MDEAAVGQYLQEHCGSELLFFQVIKQPPYLSIYANYDAALTDTLDDLARDALAATIRTAVRRLLLPEITHLAIYTRLFETVDPDWETFLPMLEGGASDAVASSAATTSPSGQATVNPLPNTSAAEGGGYEVEMSPGAIASDAGSQVIPDLTNLPDIEAEDPTEPSSSRPTGKSPTQPPRGPSDPAEYQDGTHPGGMEHDWVSSSADLGVDRDADDTPMPNSSTFVAADDEATGEMPKTMAMTPAAAAELEREMEDFTDIAEPLVLTEYCFTRNKLILTAAIQPPTEVVAKLVRSFHQLSRQQKRLLLPLLQDTFLDPENPPAIGDLPEDLQTWMRDLPEPETEPFRKGAIWLSRYCHDSVATLARVTAVLGTDSAEAALPAPPSLKEGLTEVLPTPTTQKSEAPLAGYSLIRNPSILDVWLEPPAPEIAQCIETFSEFAIELQRHLLSPLRVHFAQPDAVLDVSALPARVQQWWEILPPAGTEEARLTIIWLSRYCHDPDATLVTIRVALVAIKEEERRRKIKYGKLKKPPTAKPPLGKTEYALSSDKTSPSPSASDRTEPSPPSETPQRTPQAPLLSALCHAGLLPIWGGLGLLAPAIIFFTSTDRVVRGNARAALVFFLQVLFAFVGLAIGLFALSKLPLLGAIASLGFVVVGVSASLYIFVMATWATIACLQDPERIFRYPLLPVLWQGRG